MMYFVTTIHSKTDSRRCVGYLETYEEAEDAVLKNEYDLWENLYDYAVIEAIPSGIYQYDQNAKWFHYNEVTDTYEKCEKPEFAEHMVGFGIG